MILNSKMSLEEINLYVGYNFNGSRIHLKCLPEGEISYHVGNPEPFTTGFYRCVICNFLLREVEELEPTVRKHRMILCLL